MQPEPLGPYFVNLGPQDLEITELTINNSLQDPHPLEVVVQLETEETMASTMRLKTSLIFLILLLEITIQPILYHQVFLQWTLIQLI